MFVSGSYLPVLNSRVTRGRVLTPSDDVPGAPPVAVLSHAFWSRRLGADPSVVGRAVWLNGATFTVAGVSERGFTGTTDTAPSLWAPIASYHIALGGPPIDRTPTARVNVVGRILVDMPHEQAQAVLSAIASTAGGSLPGSDRERLSGVRFERADSRVKRGEAALLVLVFAIVTIVIGLVVLLACVNVANLLLASAISRQREMSVRLALGASRDRIVRQLLTESVSLGIAGGAIGLLMTMWLVPVLAAASNAPDSIDFAADLRVYLFLGATSVVAGLGAGLVPARHTMHDDLASPLKGARGPAAGGARPQRLRSTLIAVQAAASIVLLVLAALLTRGMLRAAHVDIGFDAARLLTISPAFGRGIYDEKGAKAYWDLALARARAVPGVRLASLSSHSPFASASSVTIFEHGGRRYTIYHNATDADYFETVGLRTVRGRTYTSAEAADSAQVAVISETLARDFFPGEDPIGQPLNRVIEGSPRVVIGVIANAITARLRELGSAAVYYPTESTLASKMMVRTSGPPEALIQSLRSALHPIDTRIRLEIQPVSEAVQRQLAEPRTLATLAGMLAGIALALAVVGLYGVTAFLVGQRRHEISVRIACGATAGDVVRLLVRDSLRPVVLGLAAGLFVAMVAGRLFAGVLYGVSSADPLAFGTAAVVLLVAALGAVIVPTHRAAAVEPASVLREL
jgi:predicted permease